MLSVKKRLLGERVNRGDVFGRFWSYENSHEASSHDNQCIGGEGWKQAKLSAMLPLLSDWQRQDPVHRVSAQRYIQQKNLTLHIAKIFLT
jgi:hypothetical protein